MTTPSGWHGGIDEFSLWNRTLTELEVQQYYNDTTNPQTTYCATDLNTSCNIINQSCHLNNNSYCLIINNSNVVLNGDGFNTSYIIINNSGVTVQDLNIYNVVNSFMCYQESANTSNQGGLDGSCGLNYNGSYDIGGFEGSFGNSAVYKIYDGFFSVPLFFR